MSATLDDEFMDHVNQTCPINPSVGRVYKEGAFAAYNFLLNRWELAMEQSRVLAKSRQAVDVDVDGCTMPFGKHKGLLLTKIPHSYLRWCLENLDLHGDLEEQIRSVVGG